MALQYDENKMSAPKVVAKGAGLIALRIREIATENRVPILKHRRWLARCIATRKLDNRSRASSTPLSQRCWHGCGN